MSDSENKERLEGWLSCNADIGQSALTALVWFEVRDALKSGSPLLLGTAMAAVDELTSLDIAAQHNQTRTPVVKLVP